MIVIRKEQYNLCIESFFRIIMTSLHPIMVHHQAEERSVGSGICTGDGLGVLFHKASFHCLSHLHI